MHCKIIRLFLKFLRILAFLVILVLLSFLGIALLWLIFDGGVVVNNEIMECKMDQAEYEFFRNQWRALPLLKRGLSFFGLDWMMPGTLAQEPSLDVCQNPINRVFHQRRVSDLTELKDLLSFTYSRSLENGFFVGGFMRLLQKLQRIWNQSEDFTGDALTELCKDFDTQVKDNKLMAMASGVLCAGYCVTLIAKLMWISYEMIFKEKPKEVEMDVKLLAKEKYCKIRCSNCQTTFGIATLANKGDRDDGACLPTRLAETYGKINCFVCGNRILSTAEVGGVYSIVVHCNGCKMDLVYPGPRPPNQDGGTQSGDKRDDPLKNRYNPILCRGCQRVLMEVDSQQWFRVIGKYAVNKKKAV